MVLLNSLLIAVFIVIGIGLGIFISQAEATTSIFIDTEKETYHYGDILTFTVKVNEITGDLATLYIIDESGKKSSPIPFPISQLMITETAPFPFEKSIYPEGKWMLEIEYAGVKDSTEFFLLDSGQVVIPIWIKDVGKMWVNDLINGEQYATAIEFLIKENIIDMPKEVNNHEEENELKIPQWIKTSTSWWSQGLITDQEYAKSLEYLLKVGIIIV